MKKQDKNAVKNADEDANIYENVNIYENAGIDENTDIYEIPDNIADEQKLNIDLLYSMNGSYTVEGTIIIPIFIFMMAVVMKMGLLLYQEIKTDTSYETATDMWLVDDFYNYQVVKEVVDELQ